MEQGIFYVSWVCNFPDGTFDCWDVLKCFLKHEDARAFLLECARETVSDKTDRLGISSEQEFNEYLESHFCDEFRDSWSDGTDIYAIYSVDLV